MIDLTPLDVRKKRGDFRKGMRGYDSQEVDNFLEMVAERLEDLAREILQLKERMQLLEQQVKSQTDREEAVRDALVTAQSLRADIRDQAQREADKVVEEARTEARRMVAEAEAEVRMRLRHAQRQADQAVHTIGELERRRLRFLRSFRQMLEREMDVIEVEESRTPLEERSFELEMGSLRQAAGATAPVIDAAAEDEEEGGEEDERAHDPAELAPEPTATEEDDGAEHATEAFVGSEGRPDQDPLDAPRRADNLLLYLDEDVELIRQGVFVNHERLDIHHARHRAVVARVEAMPM